MIIYIVMFCLSLLLINIGLSYDKKKIVSKILIVIGILLPCLLACFRDVTIGTDTNGYIYNLFKSASNASSFSQFCNSANMYFDIQDYGYLLITYLSANIFNNFNLLLFIIELLIIIPIYKALNLNKTNKNDVLIGMLIFFLFIYNVTFNMARQAIALSFTILSFALISKNKKKSSIVSLILAVLFHRTAIVSVILYLMYIYLKKERNSNKIVIPCIYGVSAILVIFHKQIIEFLSSVGIYKHGILYIELFSKIDFSFIDTFVYLVMLALIIFNKTNLINKKVDYSFYKFLAIEGLIILQLGAFIEYSERVSLYMLYPVLINSVSMIGAKDKKSSKYLVMLIAFLILYWIYTFVILNSHNTVPYVFG